MSAPPPALAVCGLGRCGSSLAMQMLAAAGVPCAGEAPDFEHPATMDAIDHDWWSAQAGRAVKTLDPHRVRPPHKGSVAIWLTRDLRQQAKSQLKFLRLVAGIAAPDDRRAVSAYAARLRTDERKALAVLPPIVLRLDFEAMVLQPGWAAGRLAAALAPWWPGLDPMRMASVVRPRGAACLNEMLEVELLREMDARA